MSVAQLAGFFSVVRGNIHKASSSVITPSDEQILVALATNRAQQPKLGRAKILVQIQSQNGWMLPKHRSQNVANDLQRKGGYFGLDPVS
ncbi:hypothetical protein F5877DRAFT_82556 [Lentinula edodes]|nr:hypothetical protein F5877DRAFT_82556 [Lentinula edodes]